MSQVVILSDDLPANAYRLLKKAKVIAWDIETTGLDWTIERIATCQLYAEGHGVYLVKGLDRRPEYICDLLEDPLIEKVFHHAPFDLRFMGYNWGVKAKSVLCTKVASRILNSAPESPPHSLKSLLYRYLGIDIDKSQRLSNWLSSELDSDQVEYAANDVRHLVALLRVLQKELSAVGYLDLYVSCCEFLPSRVELEIGRWPDVFTY